MMQFRFGCFFPFWPISLFFPCIIKYSIYIYITISRLKHFGKSLRHTPAHLVVPTHAHSAQLHFLFTLSIPCGEFRPPFLGQEPPPEQTTESYAACWVFSRFRNPPNSDMAYKTFNDHSYACILYKGFRHTESQRVLTKHTWNLTINYHQF